MIPYSDAFCPACGEAQPDLEPKPVKPVRKAWVAVLLSLLVTGLGHIYLGRWRRGLAILGVTIAVGALASFYVSYDQLMLIGAVFAVASAYDAYNLAKRKS